MSSMNPAVLVLIPLSAPALASLSARYDVVDGTQSRDLSLLNEETRRAVVALVTNGTTGCTPPMLAQLPALKVVSAYGAGYENVCVEDARAAGIQVAHAPGANGATVADHAIALALASARDICERNAAVRAGRWDEVRSARPTLGGSVVGIIGMGRIGRMVADRARAFGAAIAYHDAAAQDASVGAFHQDVAELAAASDFLFITCPGGAATYHLVDAKVLAALGRDGFLVNVSRGTVVDSASLAAALVSNAIAGAAIDVFEEEPRLPACLLEAPRLIVTPHMAGRSPASVRRQTEMLMANIDAALAGQACPHAVPEAKKG